MAFVRAMEQPQQLSRFTSKFDNKPKPVELTWGALVEALTRIRVRSTADGELWTPGSYLPGRTRTDDAVGEIYDLVLDFDDGTSVEAMCAAWDQMGLEYVVHSTYHHMREKQTSNGVHPAVPRWRAVFPLERPVPGHAWRERYKALSRHLAAKEWDRSCSNPNRVFYLPAAPDHDTGFAFHREGEHLDPYVVPVEGAPKRPEATAVDADTARIVDALRHVDPGPYDTWVLVGMALRYELGDAGFDIWNQWSSGWDGYEQGEQHDQARLKKFRSFNGLGEVTPGQTPVTLGAIYHLAKQGGWTPVKAVPASTPRTDASGHTQAADTRAVITIGTDIAPIVDATEDAIIQSPHCDLYQRAGVLVRISRVVRPPDASNTYQRPVGAPIIKPCPDAHLREICSRAAIWMAYDKREKDFVEKLPPMWVIETLSARGAWRFPPLAGTVSAPTLRPDGSVLDTPGYDARTGIVYMPDAIKIPRLKERPAKADAAKALSMLAEPFVDMPFVAQHHGSAAVAMVLALCCRAAIPGNVPLFAVRSPVRGTGKTLIADIASIIGTGRVSAKWAQNQNEDEDRKQALAIAIEGDPVVCIDNVSKPLGNGTLDMAITAGVIAGRILGQTGTAQAPWRAVTVATGNNMQVSGDMARRIVPIDLDPKCERPELRDGFRHHPLIPWVVQHRDELVHAALTIVRAYAVAGWPDVGMTAMGSFEDFSRVCRAPLIWLGCDDPAAGREAVHVASDPDLDTFRNLLQCWHDHHESEAITLRDAVEEIFELGPGEPMSRTGRALRAAIEDATSGFRRGTVATRLGYYLRTRKDRIVDGLVFRAMPKDRHGVPWVVDEV